MVSSHWPATPLCGRVGEGGGGRCLYKTRWSPGASVALCGCNVKLVETAERKPGGVHRLLHKQRTHSQTGSAACPGSEERSKIPGRTTTDSAVPPSRSSTCSFRFTCMFVNFIQNLCTCHYILYSGEGFFGAALRTPALQSMTVTHTHRYTHTQWLIY